MKDIRNKEIKIKLKENECGNDAIKRYMKRKKFKFTEIERKAGLILESWNNEEYACIWVSSYQIIGNKVEFKLAGNK